MVCTCFWVFHARLVSVLGAVKYLFRAYSMCVQSVFNAWSMSVPCDPTRVQGAGRVGKLFEGIAVGKTLRQTNWSPLVIPSGNDMASMSASHMGTDGRTQRHLTKNALTTAQSTQAERQSNAQAEPCIRAPSGTSDGQPSSCPSGRP